MVQMLVSEIYMLEPNFFLKPKIQHDIFKRWAFWEVINKALPSRMQLVPLSKKFKWAVLPIQQGGDLEGTIHEK